MVGCIHRNSELDDSKNDEIACACVNFLFEQNFSGKCRILACRGKLVSFLVPILRLLKSNLFVIQDGLSCNEFPNSLWHKTFGHNASTSFSLSVCCVFSYGFQRSIFAQIFSGILYTDARSAVKIILIGCIKVFIMIN